MKLKLISFANLSQIPVCLSAFCMMISTALISAVAVAGAETESKLNKLRIKWIELHGMAELMHKIYRNTANKIFTTEPDKIAEIFERVHEEYQIWVGIGGGDGSANANGTTKSVTVKEVIELLDSEVAAAVAGNGGSNHVLRGLAQLLQHLVNDSIY